MKQTAPSKDEVCCQVPTYEYIYRYVIVRPTELRAKLTYVSYGDTEWEYVFPQFKRFQNVSHVKTPINFQNNIQWALT